MFNYLRPINSGILKGSLEINVEGQPYQKIIDVNATVVEYNRFVVDKTGGTSSNINFGNMYFGEHREVDSILVNNTPEDFHFIANFRIGKIQNDDVFYYIFDIQFYIINF